MFVQALSTLSSDGTLSHWVKTVRITFTVRPLLPPESLSYSKVQSPLRCISLQLHRFVILLRRALSQGLLIIFVFLSNQVPFQASVQRNFSPFILHFHNPFCRAETLTSQQGIISSMPRHFGTFRRTDKGLKILGFHCFLKVKSYDWFKW